jgi:hypothetical protein
LPGAILPVSAIPAQLWAESCEAPVCYSAEVYAAYDKFVRRFGATMSVREFYEIFYRRGHEPEARIKVPKAMELAFEFPRTDEEQRVKAHHR